MPVDTVEKRRERVRLTGEPLRPAQAQARNTVTVALKLPSGLTLQGWRMEEVLEVVPGGHVMVKRATPITALGMFTCKGNSVDVLGGSRAHIVGGYGITDNCPRDLWDNWVSFNQDSHIVREELIAAFPSHADAVAFARGNRSLKSGLEPIDPTKPQLIDPRIRRGTRDNEPDEEAA